MRVSILLTCYNHLPYLPAAMAGIQAQTFADFEILALDDGSSDGTREWLQALEEPRLRCVFNERNLGTYATLNVGLREARGEFVAILNDDDLWAPAKLERQVAALDAQPKAGLAHTGGWFIDGDGNQHPDPMPLGFPFPSTPSGPVLPLLIDHNQIITSSVLVRRSALIDLGGFDESLFGSGDWQMWLRLARQWEVAYIDEPLTFYRVHGTNASHSREKIYRDDARIREWITTWEAEAPPEPELQRAFAHNWACLGTVYGWEGEPTRARKAYGESLKRMPGRAKSYLRWLATFLPRPLFRKLM